MITSDKVSAEKLRGGFYTPAGLVKVCLDRIQSLTLDDLPLRFLEPSAGDGAFIEGLSAHALRDRVKSVTAVELDEAEAQSCSSRLASTEFGGEVVAASVLEWAEATSEQYDVAVGNPPFVRFQFVSEADRQRASAILARAGVVATSVSNLWLSVFISALKKLVPGGTFAFILPAEALMGVSAQGVRAWLLRECAHVNLDLFPPDSYPSVLQEVVVLSGRLKASGAAPTRELRVREHLEAHKVDWTHVANERAQTWTRYLLSPEQVSALEVATSLPEVVPLRTTAAFSVSTVTGANDYFCASTEEVAYYGLEDWATPLLPRTRHAPGLDFTLEEHGSLSESSVNAWLVHFAADKPDPRRRAKAARFIQNGEDQGLDKRYKCRIREPWFRVPVVTPGALMMAKRSHSYPRVVMNSASVVTTDTIYRGLPTPGSPLSPRGIATTFHNSLTLLTAEIEGRSFGGGVLELVPSEVSRLSIPVSPGIEEHFESLDTIARSVTSPDDQSVVDATDQILISRIPALDADVMASLRSSRLELLARRRNRN
ncbi:Eco57I restriction-modification methylase domain-containing protein [Pseudarthrobacter sp. NS4]|uniref:Eco57I restriction-modification methylase domain-containing protein n=1 Tax=Pseudarthrobacter sp. NS4 TaxID=2973976 RepID=UPI0021623CAD|nr:hypothetical protein [Pseudarthrobacter sp. NS4]